MGTTIPVCCSFLAYDMLAAELPISEDPDVLLRGAAAIALHGMDKRQVNVEGMSAQIDRYADEVRRHVQGCQPQALLAHLYMLIFEREKFVINTGDFDNPLNNYLPVVLQTHRGTHVTIALIFHLIAHRLGLESWGIGLDKRFLIGVNSNDHPLYIDPYGGKVITLWEFLLGVVEECKEDVEWAAWLLCPTSNRFILARILGNLYEAFRKQGRNGDAAAMLEMKLLLWPNDRRTKELLTSLAVA